MPPTPTTLPGGTWNFDTNAATRLNAAPIAVALAWLLKRSPNLLLIPGTSKMPHLRENIAELNQISQ